MHQTFSEHEILDLQEHIRGESATAHACRQFAQIAIDPDLKNFCQQEARVSEANVQKLMAFMHQGQAH